MPRKKSVNVGGIVTSLAPVLSRDVPEILSVRIGGTPPKLGSLDITTYVLENTLAHLEYLRSAIERAKRKDIYDVREFGDTAAAQILAGVEERISYDDLVKLVNHWKDGIAARRLKAA